VESEYPGLRTFGVAYGRVKDSATITVANLGSATGTFKDVKAGWTAGAGLESAWGGGWSVKLEYLYIDDPSWEHWQ